MKLNSLADWLAYLEQCHPKEIDLGLDRVRAVAARLDILSPKAKVVTVAGTNGKGSCVTTTAFLIREAGFSVGVYTSPHVLHFSERIQVNLSPVDDELICVAFAKIQAMASEISLSYFEYSTLAALVIFAAANVDFIVLEVGLGGRLDAVNIIDADVAVVTSIAIDHQEWLGDNREDIGREKAGIFRDEQLVVCADLSPPKSVLGEILRLNCRAYFLGQEFSFSDTDSHWLWQGRNLLGAEVSFKTPSIPLLPLPSMAAALQVVSLLGVAISNEYTKNAVASLSLMGRFQKLMYFDREFILDVAHNPAATAFLAQKLIQDSCAFRTHAIVAMMSDKDRQESLRNVLPLVDNWYLLSLMDIPRAASIEDLTQDLLALSETPFATGTIDCLMESLLSNSEIGDRVLVFGSFFTVSAVLSYLQKNASQSRGGL